MADILFTHSYFLCFDPKEFKAMMPYAPLGTLYAAAHARSLGFSVSLFDSMLAENESELYVYFVRERPKVVVIYDDDFNYLTKMCLTRMREAAFEMSRLAKRYGAAVIVHGSDPADHVEEYIDRGADYVLIGEGEQTLGELLKHLLVSPGVLASINGIAFKENGTIQRTPHREVLQDLDVLPFPARDLVDARYYRQVWRKRHGYFSMNIVTTRGCPFHCNWCAKPIYGQVYHSRSPQNVVEEMAFIKKEYHPDHLWFCDDIFGLKPGWVPRLADAVVERNARIPFKCLSRADLLLKENTVEHLARAGCQTVWIGAESGSQKILDAMEKGTTIGQIHSSARLLHENGIRVGFFLQYGYPGETHHEIEQTLQMVKECKPDEIGISVSYPLPGTKFHENVKQQLGSKTNWVDSQDLDLMYRGTYTTEFYRALHKVTHKKFRVWQGRDILKSCLTNPSNIPKGTMRRMAALVYHTITLPSAEAGLKRLERQAH